MKESKNENLSALITEGDIQQLIADIKGLPLKHSLW